MERQNRAKVDEMRRKKGEQKKGKRVAALLLAAVIVGITGSGSHVRLLAAEAGAEIVLQSVDYDPAQSEKTTLQKDVDGQGTEAVVTGEDGRAVWRFSVEEAGSYFVRVQYYSVPDSALVMERRLSVDGKAYGNFEFRRSYSAEGETAYDRNGNEIRRKEQEDLCWQEVWLADPEGYGEEVVLELEPGEHTLCLDSLLGKMAIGSILLTSQRPQAQSYEEVFGGFQAEGVTDGNLELKKVQAEQYLHKSDASIRVSNDRTSVATEPGFAKTIVYNTIGGDSWNKAGQWIEWEIEVPSDGFYWLGMRWRQNVKTGGMSSRSLTIDGEEPFGEAGRLLFCYDNAWQVSCFGGAEPYCFYLTKGVHRIRLTAGLGDLAPVLAETDRLLEDLNEMYMKIIMVSGTSPDLKRDYNFAALIPEVIEQYHTTAGEIEELMGRVDAVTQGRQSTAELGQMRDVLEWMYEDPETTGKRLSDFSSSISALAGWLSDSRRQPLEIDYLFVASPGTELPRAGGGFLASLGFQLKQLLGSYTMDYTSIGNTSLDDEEEEALKVWVIAGTEQAQVLQKLINEQFIPDSSIPVKLENVTKDALMPAIFAGRGPDVVLNLDEASPVNYALRGVLLDLTEFSDIDQVLDSYEPCAYEAFELGEELYALPTSMDYPVLFYRKDILEEMDISLEECETWDTMLQAVLPKLQIRNLRFGLPAGNAAVSSASSSLNSFLMFYYQGGNELYNEEHTRTTLDTKEAFAAFKDYSSIYTDYRQDRTFDFVNLFRSGEMPIAVVPYSQYYQLALFAPEIEGKWGVLLAPGTRDAMGNVDHTVACTVTGASILADTENPQDAWEFLKWWAGGETQSVYAREVETVLGIGGRVSPAANEARASIAWNREMKKLLEEQLSYCRGVPQVPGSYYVGRYFDFAFRDVANQGDDIAQTLIGVTEDINAEIREKTLELRQDGR